MYSAGRPRVALPPPLVCWRWQARVKDRTGAETYRGETSVEGKAPTRRSTVIYTYRSKRETHIGAATSSIPTFEGPLTHKHRATCLSLIHISEPTRQAE